MEYLLNKINNVNVIQEPFPHIIISNFFNDDDLNNILNNININKLSDINSKYEKTYYPGAINKKINLLKRPSGKGLVYSLKRNILQNNSSLIYFLDSDKLKEVLFNKFNKKNIDGWNVYQINKDLNGYEISPHPDVTGKVITYQINLTNTNYLNNYNLSTKLHKIKPEYKNKIEELKKKETRPWGKWEWFDEGIHIPYIKNTFFAFAPSDNTYHSVKLENYPQDNFQRTMLRGFFADTRLLNIKEKSYWNSGNLINI